MRILRILLACCALALATGCASIVTGHNQSLSVTARQDSGEVSGADCRLSNDKGTWFVKTPGSALVHRSYEDLVVRCEKTGMEPGTVNAKSSTKGMALGNVLFGGLIGAGVDMSTGAAYDYPEMITVQMGRSTVVSPPESQPANTGAAPHDVPAQPAPADSSGAAPPPAGLKTSSASPTSGVQ